MSPPPGRFRSVALLGGGTLLAALFGLLFQALLSYHFGAGAESDAWFMSLSIYGFLGKFLMLTNVKALALPAYKRLQVAEPGAAVRFEGRLILWLGALTGAVSALIVLGAPLLVDALAPGYAGDQRALTVSLVRIRTPALAFLAVSTGGLVALEAAYRFGVTVTAQKVAPALVSLVLFALVADRFGMIGVGWAGLAGGVAGGVVALAATAPMLRTRGGVSPGGREAARRELRAIGADWFRFGGSNAASFVGEWAFRVAASLLPVGLFSAVLYGRMVHDLLHAGINDSAQTVSMPRFAQAAAGGAPSAGAEVPERAAVEEAATRVGPQLREALATLSALSLPLSAFVAVTAPWSVALLFGRGRFLEDGMLDAASLSLRIFALAFLVQGLNQLLFAAAFASGRSGLVNRVQIVGHLARAAALVPAVLAYSFVGLVGAQVAMNVLVFALLLVWAPEGWGVGPGRALAAAFGRPAGGTLLGTALLTGLWLALAPRLPDPLALGTVGRLGVLAAAAAGWTVAHVVLAGALGVPAVRGALRRLRGALACLVGVGLLAAAPGHARAQSTGAALLPADHWSRGVLEILEARGALEVGGASGGPLAGWSVERLLEGADAPWAPAALRALRHELAGGGAAGIAASAAAGGRWGSLEAATGEGALAAAWIRAGTDGSRWFAHLEGEAGPGASRHGVVRGGVGVRLGPLALQAGREQVQLGGGAGGGLVLSAGVPLDGILLSTLEPLDAGILGGLTLTVGVGPMGRYEAVDDPWFALLRVAAHPAPWLQLGMSRAALVGGSFPGGTVPWDPKVYGPDTASLSPGDLLGMLVGRVTGFDNQIGAFDARVSLAPLGLPALAWAEIGLEDKDRSWGDGALQAGLVAAPWGDLPVAFRYEYTAFGDPARWCAWCDTLPAFWYQHARFQDGWQVEGELLGHPLGGYGLQHLLGVTAFDPTLRLHVQMDGGWLRRDRWNLLEDRRPGGALWARSRLRYRTPGGTELRLEGRWERGEAGWSGGTVRVTLGRLLGP